MVFAAVDPLFASLGAAALAALGAYFIALRRASGTIQTSEASDLWEESKAIRQELRDRITELNLEIGRLQGRLEAVEGRNTELDNKIAEQRDTIVDLRTDLKAAKDRSKVSESEVEMLEGRLRKEKEKVTELEQRA